MDSRDGGGADAVAAFDDEAAAESRLAEIYADPPSTNYPCSWFIVELEVETS